MNLLATFFNCVYLIFTFVFDWMENLHHIMERWEAGQPTEESLIYGSASAPSQTSNSTSTDPPASAADGDLHRAESHFFISIMAVLRILLVASYLNFEARKIPLYSYMQVNWMGWPQYRPGLKLAAISLPVSRGVKQKLLELQPWNSFMLNLYSV